MADNPHLVALMNAQNRGFVRMHYRFKRDSTVHTRILSSEEADHFASRCWLEAGCDYLQYQGLFVG